MSDEKMNTAIAEACGWDSDDIARGYTLCQFSESVPDYCNDLNAMHEAEMMLKSEDCHTYGCYCSNLYEDFGNTVSLTARQRAEAFLKTIGKWEGGTQ